MLPVKTHLEIEGNREGERDGVRLEAENQTAICRGRGKGNGRRNGE
jgi:hypothetical protein